MIGILIAATTIKIDTKTNLAFKKFGLIRSIILSLKEYKIITKYVCATISKIINDNIIILLNNLNLLANENEFEDEILVKVRSTGKLLNANISFKD